MRNGAVSSAFRVAVAAAHVRENSVIDAVVIAPPADGVVPLVALDEPVLRPHRERLEGERLVRAKLFDREIALVQQQTIGAENEVVLDRLGVDSGSQIDAEVLNHRLRLRIDEAACQRLIGNVEVRLQK